MNFTIRNVIGVILSFPLLLYAQIERNEVCKTISPDCKEAVVVQLNNGVICYSAKPLKGFGKTQEIQTKSNLLFEQEHNTAWYLINILRNGEMVFEIAPYDTTNDYDFLLYKYTDTLFCNSFFNNTIVPIRSNLSKNNFRNAGCTGLSSYAKSNYTNKSSVDSYSNALPVKDGEKYILLFDNLTKGAGYTSYISFAKKININGTVKDVTSVPLSLSVTLKDRIGHIVKQTTSAVDGSFSLSANVSEDENYILVFESPTCFTETTIINTKDISPSTNNFSVNKSMKKLKLGVTYDFTENVTEFMISEFHRMQVYELYKLMMRNPKMKIQIQGHSNTNDFGYAVPVPDGDKNSNTDQLMSENRAGGVYYWLEKYGVNSSRIEMKGFSSSKLLITKPKTDEEKNKNKRVTIKILSL